MQAMTVLNQTGAKNKKELFITEYGISEDDAKATAFYDSVLAKLKEGFEQSAPSTEPIGFIVVANMMHTAPYFLEAVAKLGDVLALVPKHSKVVKHVEKTLRAKLYGEIIYDQINRDVLSVSAEGNEQPTHWFLENVLAKQKEGQNYQIIILDHGGYFANVLAKAKENRNFCPGLLDRIIGVVEHTYNGEVSYNNRKEKIFPCPILSVAHSDLKDHESTYVAHSIVYALIAKICSGEGINQEFSRLSSIVIIGYGRIGSRVAMTIRNLLGEKSRNIIKIVDTVDGALTEAEKNKFIAANIKSEQAKKFIKEAKLIITAASAPCLTAGHFTMMESNPIVACATSSDNQFEAGALKNAGFLAKPVEIGSKLNRNYQVYVNESTKKEIILASDGDSVNFLIGSTSHPVLHAVLASVLEKAWRLINNHLNLPRDQIITDTINKDLIMQSYHDFYGELPKGEFEQAMWFSRESIAKLRNHYLSPTETIAGKSLGSDDHYINLEILDRLSIYRGSHVDRETHDHEIAPPPLQLQPRDLLKSNAELYPNKIFNGGYRKPDDWEKKPRIVVLQGNAGIGKTTLIDFMTRQWAQHKLFEDKAWVFILPLREVCKPAFQNVSALWYWVYLANFENLCSETEFESLWFNAIEPLIAQNKVVFLLDGNDELPAKHSLNAALKYLFNSTLATVIITTRSYGLADLPDRTRIVEITGFTKENIERFIRQFFLDRFTPLEADIKAQQITTGLDGRANIMAIAHIPINLALICSIVEDNVLNWGSFNKTELYIQFVHGLLKRLAKKEEKKLITHRMRETQYNNALTIMRDLAFNGMRTNKNIFSEKELPEIDNALLEQLAGLGIRLSGKIDFPSFHFLHLTLQEYFAGEYLALSLLEPEKSEDAKKWIFDHRFDPKIQNVLWFVAGLLSHKKEKQALKEFIVLLEQEPKDLIGSYQMALVTRAIEEGITLLPDEIVQKRIQQLDEFISHNLNLHPADYYRYEFILQQCGLCPQLLTRLFNQWGDKNPILIYLERIIKNPEVSIHNVEQIIFLIQQLQLTTSEVKIRLLAIAKSKHCSELEALLIAECLLRMNCDISEIKEIVIASLGVGTEQSKKFVHQVQINLLRKVNLEPNELRTILIKILRENKDWVFIDQQKKLKQIAFMLASNNLKIAGLICVFVQLYHESWLEFDLKGIVNAAFDAMLNQNIDHLTQIAHRLADLLVLKIDKAIGTSTLQAAKKQTQFGFFGSNFKLNESPMTQYVLLARFSEPLAQLYECDVVSQTISNCLINISKNAKLVHVKRIPVIQSIIRKNTPQQSELIRLLMDFFTRYPTQEVREDLIKTFANIKELIPPELISNIIELFLKALRDFDNRDYYFVHSAILEAIVSFRTFIESSQIIDPLVSYILYIDNRLAASSDRLEYDSSFQMRTPQNIAIRTLMIILCDNPHLIQITLDNLRFQSRDYRNIVDNLIYQFQHALLMLPYLIEEDYKTKSPLLVKVLKQFAESDAPMLLTEQSLKIYNANDWVEIDLPSMECLRIVRKIWQEIQSEMNFLPILICENNNSHQDETKVNFTK